MLGGALGALPQAYAAYEGAYTLSILDQIGFTWLKNAIAAGAKEVYYQEFAPWENDVPDQHTGWIPVGSPNLNGGSLNQNQPEEIARDEDVLSDLY